MAADTVPTGCAARRALADIAALFGMPQGATPTEVVEAVRAVVPVPTTIGEWDPPDRGPTLCRHYHPSGDLAAAVSPAGSRFAWDVWRDRKPSTFADGIADTLQAARDAADCALGIVP